ncbi:ZIP family metal transporter [Marinilongibacter aquaticus]|uniref:ZIP family metal transporter n=1 Tax=Marinilongibacter aquaticus TaxID=2975157 RepID=UPI0021BDEEC3|nr:ZIP family metal transporter [Marinilongibacter aquaticus]UBM57547.1 ZIP family metal transporter [Marinilongibacter aquaticus]
MDLEKLLEYNPVLLALGGSMFTYFVTALGAAMVFFFKEINQKLLNLMLGFAAGVMLAASFWSLLSPAIEMSEEAGTPGWIPALSGFLVGAVFLYLFDQFLPHLHLGEKVENAEGVKTSWQRSILLIMAITLHNIPEGLAVGVAFGALAQNPDIGVLSGAIALAIGIGIQDFPEGAAVSIPLRREGFSRLKAFNYGQLSGLVEPIAGVVGAYLVLSITSILPYALSFAAGAMVYVVVEELIPESQRGDKTDLSTVGTMFGFALMMFLDVALG